MGTSVKMQFTTESYSSRLSVTFEIPTSHHLYAVMSPLASGAKKMIRIDES